MGNQVYGSDSPLRTERERRGWSRSFVAEQIGSDRQSVARWERGEYFPTPQLRQQLCALFQMDATTLGLIKPQNTREEEQHQTAAPATLAPPTLPPELLAYTPETHEKTSPPITDPLTSRERNTVTQQRWLLTGGSLLVLLTLLGVFFSRVAFPWADTRILPGGMWITPDDGQTVGNTLHFAAHAYPTKPTDPAIEYVKFTIRSSGHWAVACIATPLKNSDIFSCTADLLQLRIVPGSIKISFDVYDHNGNYHLAPHGTRTLLYQQ